MVNKKMQRPVKHSSSTGIRKKQMNLHTIETEKEERVKGG